MQIEGKRLIPGANVVTQKCSLWQQKEKGEVRLWAAGRLAWGFGEDSGLQSGGVGPSRELGFR